MFKNQNSKKLVYCAILITMSIVLNQVKLFHMPMGGSVTLLSMLFATLAGYLCGPKWGLSSGVTLGILNIVFGGYLYHPVQVLLDYILAFGALGLSGFFSKTRKDLYIGYIVGVSGRLFFSFLSGYFFFKSFAPKGWNPLLYSFCYQLGYLGVEAIITLFILSIPTVHNNIFRLKKSM